MDKKQLFTEHLTLALKTAREAATIISTSPDSIKIQEEIPYSVFSIIQKDEDIQSASRFFTMLAQATENDCNYAYLDENITDEEIANMKEGVIDSELIIFAVFYKGRGYSKQLASSNKINAIVNKISDSRSNILIFFGDPYIADKIICDNKILTYSDSFPSIAAAVMVLADRKLELQ